MRLFEGTPFDRPPQCDRCGKPEAECDCPTETPARTPNGKQTARIGVEKRKGGKVVTVVRGLADEGDHLAKLLTQLKSACGAGGSIQADVIELQGDQRERIAKLLAGWGYRVR